MIKIKKKPIIIEFVGIPGSGKTTIKNEIIVKMNQKKISVIDANKIAQDKQKFKIFKIMKIAFLNLGIIFKILKKYGFNKFYFQQIYYFEKLSEVLKSTNSCDYIIVDQGFVQGISSVYNFKELEENNLFQKYLVEKISKFKIVFVDISIPVEQSILRVSKRESNIVEFETMLSNNSFQNFSFTSRKNLDIIRKKFLTREKIIDINGANGIEYNANKIMFELLGQ